MSTYRPNVVLLHIGTNDMARGEDAGASQRLGSLIDQLLAAEPTTTVLVSTLVPSSTPAVENRIFAYNQTIPEVVAQRQNAGKRVWTVDMDAVTAADLADSLHPNDTGYAKMADAFYEGIQSVESAGWVAAPGEDDPTEPGEDDPGPSCKNQGIPERGAIPWTELGQIASGVAPDALANPYNPRPAENSGLGEKVQFADLNGDRRDDYIAVNADSSATAYLNGGLPYKISSE